MSNRLATLLAYRQWVMTKPFREFNDTDYERFLEGLDLLIHQQQERSRPLQEQTSEWQVCPNSCGTVDPIRLGGDWHCGSCGAFLKQVGQQDHRTSSLFQIGEFELSSGQTSYWKIDCDALTEADWDALAMMAAEVLEPFSMIVSVPMGGDPFAKALEKYCTEQGGLLVVEDVVTTGASMERIRAGRDAQGITVFSRGQAPPWVRVLFQYKGDDN